MSQENVELVRYGYEQFLATGKPASDVLTADFVWDMSTFIGWPEQQTYEGVDGVQAFLNQWLENWDDWRLELESLHDKGEKVVAVVRQHARSKTTGLAVEMVFGQVWTIRHGKEARMEMYADPEEALAAAT